MYQTGYHATGYHETGYYLPVDVIIPPPSGGGGGGVSAPGFNQAPSVKKDRELYIDQAHNEDEELIILLKAFAEVIQWH